MNSMTLTIQDLNASQTLDRQARQMIRGRGEWHLLSTSISTGAWSGYVNTYKNYVGTTFHDGYLSKQYSEGWKRTRTQTEYSAWNHFVRV
jgi:hypothetical protein